MSVKIASLYAEITADASKLNSALASSKSGLGQFGSDLKGALLGLAGFTSAAAVGGMAIKEFVKYIKTSVAAAAESQVVMTRLNATLIATGRASETSSEAIEKFATQLSRTTTFDDEAIVSAYNALAKFENLPTDKIDDVVTAATDLAAATGGDLASSAEMIGRILETGTIPRTLAFSSALKEQVQASVAAGDSGKALTLVLDELNRRYGGQAAAALDTYTGSTIALKNAMENYQETVGNKVLPASQKLNTWLTNSINTQTDYFNSLQGLNEEQQARAEHLRSTVGYEQAYKYVLEQNQLVMDSATRSYIGMAMAAEEAAVAQELLNTQLVQGQTAWELAYTGAETAAERTKLSTDYIGEQLQALGEQGSLVWNGYLAATGQISPAAAAEFVRVQDMFNRAKAMLAAGISVPIVISFLVAGNAAAGTQGYYDVFESSAASGSGASTSSSDSNPYWIPDPNNPGHYMVNPSYGKAAGGYVSSRYAITGDRLDGKPTGYEELVDFQDKRVYSAPQTRAMIPHLAGGSMPGMQVPGQVSLSLESIRLLAEALSVKLQPYL